MMKNYKVRNKKIWAMGGLTMTVRSIGVVIAAIATVVVTTAAVAQTSNASSSTEEAQNAIEEITVTAQRREQSLSDVPMAITAFSAEDLRENSVVRPADLMKITPGLSGREVEGAFIAYAIRGITSNVTTIDAESSVGIFIDSMYVGRFGAGAGALFDIERVEVLKGPQSTMFGRNSSAGAISIISNKPTEELGAEVALRYASRNTREAELVLNLPVNDKLSTRFAGRFSDTDGFTKYVLTGNTARYETSSAARFSLRYDPNESISFDLSMDYEDSEFGIAVLPADDRPFYKAIAPTGTFDGKVYANVEDVQDVELWGVNGRLTIELNDTYTVESLTAYRSFDFTQASDLDATVFSIFQFDYETGNDTFFQDLRLRHTSDRVDGFIGISYWSEEAEGDTLLNYNEIDTFGPYGINAFPGFGLCDALAGVLPNNCFDGLFNEDFFQDGETTTFSIYGDVEFSVTDRLNVAVGLRYLKEDKKMRNESTAIQLPSGAAIPTFGQLILGATLPFGGAFLKTVGVTNLKDTYYSVQPRLAVDYALNDTNMGYANIGRGFKSGGFNSPLVSADRQKFGEETSWSYEAGLKSTLFGGRALWNTAVYYFEYKDYQDRTTLEPEVTPFVANAALVEGYGIETDMQAQLTDSTNLQLTFSWNSTEYGEYDDQVYIGPGIGFVDVSFKGNRLPFTPEYSGSIGLRNTSTLGSLGALTSFISYSYHSETFFNRQNTFNEGSVNLFRGYLTLHPEGKKWSISLYGENLLDEEYVTTKGAAMLSGMISARIGKPRTVGVEFRYNMN